ncbi:hypothetical protein DFH09DRAFT_1079604 [Mycena vulgaris]|nr:hypothetical protein DFH09DRAFT_1094565 [Mycena vulgaris]KAJ6572392.1 hypothetical protein DFH09DRAFT_1079604 [Mycena vulgaris]
MMRARSREHIIHSLQVAQRARGIPEARTTRRDTHEVTVRARAPRMGQVLRTRKCGTEGSGRHAAGRVQEWSAGDPAEVDSDLGADRECASEMERTGGCELSVSLAPAQELRRRGGREFTSEGYECKQSVMCVCTSGVSVSGKEARSVGGSDRKELHGTAPRGCIDLDLI